MASPSKHPSTSIYRVRVAVPARLRDVCGRLYASRWELIENLGTKDAKEAKERAGAARDRVMDKLKAAEAVQKGEQANLSDRDVHALAGMFYRSQVAAVGDNPGHPDQWPDMKDGLLHQVEGTAEEGHTIDPSPADLEAAAALLASHGLPADPRGTGRLAIAVFEAKWNHATLMERRARGDWGPDPLASKIPTPSPALARRSPRSTEKAGTFNSLLEGFALDRGWGRLDAKPIHRALYDRKRTLARLAAFLHHEDAARVTKADAVAWKEDMQARGLHASTVRNDLSECSAVWKWATRNHKLPEGCGNPFEGISPPKAKKKAQTRRPFTDDEAGKVLAMARQETGVLRWLPWVCCLTGARLNELVQSVKEDVSRIGDVPVVRVRH